MPPPSIFTAANGKCTSVRGKMTFRANARRMRERREKKRKKDSETRQMTAENEFGQDLKYRNYCILTLTRLSCYLQLRGARCMWVVGFFGSKRDRPIDLSRALLQKELFSRKRSLKKVFLLEKEKHLTFFLKDLLLQTDYLEYTMC